LLLPGKYGSAASFNAPGGEGNQESVVGSATSAWRLLCEKWLAVLPGPACAALPYHLAPDRVSSNHKWPVVAFKVLSLKSAQKCTVSGVSVGCQRVSDINNCCEFGLQSRLCGVTELSGLVRRAHTASLLLPSDVAQAKVKLLAGKQHGIHCRQNYMWKQRQPLFGSATSFNAEGGDGGSNCRSVAAMVGNCESVSHCESVGNCESVSHCKSVSSAEVTWVLISHVPM